MSIGPKITGLGLGLYRPMLEYSGPRPRPIIKVEGLGPASASEIHDKASIKYIFHWFYEIKQKIGFKNTLQSSILKKIHDKCHNISLYLFILKKKK